jgi:hypothetical protein
LQVQKLQVPLKLSDVFEESKEEESKSESFDEVARHQDEEEESHVQLDTENIDSHSYFSESEPVASKEEPILMS